MDRRGQSQLCSIEYWGYQMEGTSRDLNCLYFIIIKVLKLLKITNHLRHLSSTILIYFVVHSSCHLLWKGALLQGYCSLLIFTTKQKFRNTKVKMEHLLIYLFINSHRISSTGLALLPLPHPLCYLAALIWKRFLFKHDQDAWIPPVCWWEIPSSLQIPLSCNYASTIQTLPFNGIFPPQLLAHRDTLGSIKKMKTGDNGLMIDRGKDGRWKQPKDKGK